MTREAVVLIPGISLLFGLELIPLKRRLEQKGYAAHIFFYGAWRTPLESCVSRLERFMRRVAPMGAHLLGHSFGGLIASKFASAMKAAPPMRIVTLGTPHLGAQAARKLGRSSLMRALLGPELLSALDAAPFRLPSNVEMGTIGGSLDPGLGRLWGLREPSDGLVCVKETLHPDAVDSLTVPSTHATMLVSKTVADHIVGFLTRGRFARAG